MGKRPNSRGTVETRKAPAKVESQKTPQELRCVSGTLCSLVKNCDCRNCKAHSQSQPQLKVDKKLKVPCTTCKKMVQGSFMDGELTCGICGTLLKRVQPATKQTPTAASPLATKLKENGATKPKETPPTKKIGWRWIQDGDKPSFAILQIVNGDSGDYLFQRLTTEEFRLTKLEEDRSTSYTVSIGKVKRCGCEGFKRRQTCKHVDALVALRKEGKL